MKTMMPELTSIEELQEKLEQKATLILVFSADWCPDCMFIKPFMPRLIEKYEELQFVYVDTTQFPEVVKQYEVMGIPSFIAIKDGVEISRFVSKLRKTEAEINDFLKDCIA